MINLTPRLRLAADLIEQAGWVQGKEKDNEGRVCLTGAVRFCAPQTGDEYLIREVLRKRGRAEGWNDAYARTSKEVIDFLRTAEVTDADLADTFGPQWREVVTLVRQAATLMDEQVSSLAAAWDAAGDAAQTVAWNAVQTVAQTVARSEARNAAGDAAEDAAGDAAGNAAAAISTRDLIGTAGYTQEHFNILINPWVSVMGMPEAATS